MNDPAWQQTEQPDHEDGADEYEEGDEDEDFQQINNAEFDEQYRHEGRN